jgi:hypothetical protein
MLSQFLPGRSDFESNTGIIRFIVNSKNFDPKTEDPDKAEALLLFSTSNQHTWLVATQERLYCILDDLRKDKPHINWSIPKRKLVSGQHVSINLRSRDHSQYSGLIDIGDEHPEWLYTKRLFVDNDVKNQIIGLIRRNMIERNDSFKTFAE